MTVILDPLHVFLQVWPCFYKKNLKIPVRNQKCHPKLLRGRFQDTEKKEQFLTKNWRFCTKNEVFLAPWDTFTWMHLKYWVSVHMLIAIPVKMERKLHFKASKSSKMSILGLNGRFLRLKWHFLRPKCWFCLLKISTP